jgi:hypothetical protein
VAAEANCWLCATESRPFACQLLSSLLTLLLPAATASKVDMLAWRKQATIECGCLVLARMHAFLLLGINSADPVNACGATAAAMILLLWLPFLLLLLLPVQSVDTAPMVQTALLLLLLLLLLTLVYYMPKLAVQELWHVPAVRHSVCQVRVHGMPLLHLCDDHF